MALSLWFNLASSKQTGRWSNPALIKSNLGNPTWAQPGEQNTMTTVQERDMDIQQSWQAVQTRDRRFDGRFVYAVKSTGVYCNPSCPSRRPQPEQVRFFTGPAEAQSAGFRACRRCLPDRLAGESDRSALVQRACNYIDQAIRDHAVGETSQVAGRESMEIRSGGLPTVSGICLAVGVTPSRLRRAFKAEAGLTPRQYAHARRLERFKGLVRNSNDVAAAMYDAGYGSASRLYENSGAHLGMSPGRYRKGGAGAVIFHTVSKCRLGWLLVGATERGVCSTKLGDDPSELSAELRREFPAALHQQDDGRLKAWVDEILSYLDGSQRGLDLPLDVRATAFQWRVWQLLQSIPYGETRTYQDMSLELGLGAKAARAVGRACASNPVSLIVPCHRARRKDGGLAGYRWGLSRKEALLALERRTAPAGSL